MWGDAGNEPSRVESDGGGLYAFRPLTNRDASPMSGVDSGHGTAQVALKFRHVEVQAELQAAMPGGLKLSGLLVYDWDGDAIADLLGVPPNASVRDSIVIQRGLGNGQFGPSEPLVTTTELGLPNTVELGYGLAVADVDLDGDLDLITGMTNGGGAWLSHIANDGGGSWTSGAPSSGYPGDEEPTLWGQSRYRTNTGEVVDALWIRRGFPGGVSVSLALPSESGLNLNRPPLVTTDNVGQLRALRVGAGSPLDVLGSPSGPPLGESLAFVVTERALNDVWVGSVLFDGATGRFSEPTRSSNGYGLVACGIGAPRLVPQGVPTRDLSGNALPWENYTTVLDTDYWVSTNCNAITAADLDGDGLEDLVVRSVASAASEGTLVWMRSLGEFQFADPVQLAVTSRYEDVTLDATDLDGDGDLDIVETKNDASGWLWLYLNDGAP